MWEWHKKFFIIGLLRLSRRFLADEQREKGISAGLYDDGRRQFRIYLIAQVSNSLQALCEEIIPPETEFSLRFTEEIREVKFPDSRGQHQEFWLHIELGFHTQHDDGATTDIAMGEFDI